MNINKIMIAGRLTKEPQIYRKNHVMAKYTVAINSGERVEFISCIAYDRQAEIAESYLHQGKEVLVIGRLQLDRDPENGRILYVNLVVQEQHFGKESTGFKKSGNTFEIPEEMEEEMPFQ